MRSGDVHLFGGVLDPSRGVRLIQREAWLVCDGLEALTDLVMAGPPMMLGLLSMNVAKAMCSSVPRGSILARSLGTAGPYMGGCS